MAFNLKDEFSPILQQYALYQRNIKGLSASTVNEYCLDLRTFFRFMKRFNGMVPSSMPLDEIKVDDINIDFIKKIKTYDIFEYMNYVADDRNNLSAARQRKSTTLRSFFNYLYTHEKLLDENPAEGLISPKKKKSLPRYLSLEQSVDLLNSIDGTFRERDYCIMVLFLNCGMRLSELVGLNISDIRHKNNVIRILGKGNKERMVYLNETCLDAIEQYIKVRPQDGVIDKNALFLSKRKKRISPKTVQYIVKKYLSEIGLADYSVHKLRHTAATLMYQYGNVDIRVLQDILGHENLGTTQIYTHTSNKQTEAAIKANPLNSITLNHEKKDK